MPDLPWTWALLGGAMIGAAASVLYLMLGRIAGVSGVLGELLLSGDARQRAWHVAFVLGMVAGCWLVRELWPQFAQVNLQGGWASLAIAGLLVGYGTRMGGGCTSGHGICGIARLSPRSLVATVVFMASAILTVALMRLTGAAA